MIKKVMFFLLSLVVVFSCQPPDLFVPDDGDTVLKNVSAPFSWTSSGRLIDVKSDGSHNCASIKDPTVVNSGGKWHIYATVYNRSQSTYNMVYLSFTDWNQAGSATQYFMDSNSSLGGYKCAPCVFYCSEKSKWFLVYQTQDPAYSTASTLGGPSNWSGPTKFYSSKPAGAPSLWIDYFVIADSSNYYLFCAGDDGKLYRAQTSRSNFPNGFGSFTTCLSMSKNDLFEGPAIYKISGQNNYLLVMEAIGSQGRYYKAFTSSSLTGSWSAIAGSESSPFAGKNNVSGNFSNDVSHGEILRAGTDETMTINNGTLQFLYQGSTGSNSSYDLIPWSLGLLTQKGSGSTTTTTTSSGSSTTTSSGGSGNITVRARGTKGGEKLEVQANGTTVGTFTMSTSYADYKVNGSGTIRVAFTNDDQQSSGMDIQVDYVTIDGTTYQAENQATNTGVYQNSQCGGSNSEWLHCNGYIEFNAGTSTPAPGTTTTTTSSGSSTTTSSGGTGSVSIACGSSSAVGSFQADQYYSGGSTYNTSNTVSTSGITNPPPAALFNNERYGAMTYTIPGFTAGSTYTVTLYFAETYLTSSGSRSFNVSINGSQVLSNFDIYASAGGQNKAIARPFTATANSSGQIVIQFTNVTENAKINGISIQSGGSTTTSTGSSTTTTSTGSGSITVRARGTKGGEKLEVQVNGTAVATFTMTTSYANYSASGSGTIRVAFTNDDQQSNGMDIQVDYVVIDGTTYQAENQATNTGVYQNSQCGGSNSEWLHCNGYIQF